MFLSILIWLQPLVRRDLAWITQESYGVVTNSDRVEMESDTQAVMGGDESVRPSATDLAKFHAKHIFVLITYKNYKMGYCCSCHRAGHCGFWCEIFCPDWFFFAQCAKKHSFPPEEICPGFTFPPHFDVSQPHIFSFASAQSVNRGCMLVIPATIYTTLYLTYNQHNLG